MAVAPLALAAFAWLVAALATLWAPRLSASRGAILWWTAPFALSLACAAASGVVNPLGLMALVLLAAACRAARLATPPRLNLASHALMLGIAATLFVHAAPGFDNPRVLDGVQLSADSLPYTGTSTSTRARRRCSSSACMHRDAPPARRAALPPDGCGVSRFSRWS